MASSCTARTGTFRTNSSRTAATSARDAYGGSVENRARLMLETADAMIGAWDVAHVGVRLSPASYLYGVDDSDKRATFGFGDRRSSPR